LFRIPALMPNESDVTNSDKQLALNS